MVPRKLTRRGLVTFFGGIALAGSTGAVAAPLERAGAADADSSPTAGASRADGALATGAAVTRESYTIMAGTEHATDVYVVRAAADGPTALVVGGVHGNEVSGYRAANAVADWTIDAGTLVVLPEANAVAIEDGTRFGESGDLNRQFPTGEEPTTELARAIWGVVTRHEPDLLVDLHRSLGIYGVDEGAEGQAVFFAPDAAGTAALETVQYANDEVVPDTMPTYDFRSVPIDFGMDPSGLLVGKTAQDLGAWSFLVEVTSKDVELETQVDWTLPVVRQLLAGELLLEDPPENQPPVARISTTPADAAATDVSEGATVALDASRSSDADGDVVEYAWDLDGDGAFEADGEHAELSLDFCGDLTVRLRVTDDAGATDTASVTLSTVE